MAVVNYLLFGLQESRSVSFNGYEDTSVSYMLTSLGYNVDNYYLKHNGCPVQDLSQPLLLDQDEKDNGMAIIRASPRLLGGKGGFGALIRAMGMRVNKNRGRDASRDLSGRRIRDVNAEKQLAEWAKKEPERKKRKEEEKAKKRKALLEGPKHFFNDPDYMQQLEENEITLDEAVKKGLTGATSSNGKRKREREEAQGNKRMLMLGIEELCSDDSESEEEEKEAPVKRLKETNESNDIPQLKDIGREATPPTPTAADPSPTHPLSNIDGQSSPIDTQTLSNQHPSTNTAASSHTQTSQPSIGSTTDLHSHPPLPPHSAAQEQSGGTNGVEIDQETIDKFDLDDYESVEGLESVGPHLLKAVLQKLGLKCGGTLNERATRLFSVKGLTLDQIDPSLFAGKTNGKRKNKGKGKNANK